MERKLILRGVLVGAIAGLLAFLFARIFAEPVISRAIDYESGRDAAQAALDKVAGLPTVSAGPDIFSRTVQANLGIGAGMILFGAAIGSIFAVVYTICLGRTGRIRPRTLAPLVALGGFLAFYLVPFLKYPANPPAIGHEDTIKERSALYLVMVASSIVLLALVLLLGRRLQARWGNWTATLVAVGSFVVAIDLVMALLRNSACSRPTSSTTARMPPKRRCRSPAQTAQSSIRDFPLMISGNSGSIRSPRNSSSGRPSGCCSRLWPIGCSARLPKNEIQQLSENIARLLPTIRCIIGSNKVRR